VVVRAFPARVLGLRVRSVADALTARRDGAIVDELVAIGAWLTVDSGPRDCATGSYWRPPPDPALCHRATSLADRTATAMRPSSTPARAGDTLLAHAFPGVSLGILDALEAGGANAPDASVGTDGSASVVVVGRFGDPRLADRRSSARHPDIGFSIERLVWVAGRWQERGIAQSLPRSADEVARSEVPALASAALPGGTVVLYYAALAPATLTRLQPSAALAVDAAETDDLFWYVRVMTRERQPVRTLASDTSPRRLGWVVLAPDGTVLGSALDT
jgi:hypothetical protein